MGKRKAAKKVQGPKKREPLANTFTCLFCNHEKSIQVKLDKKAAVGDLWCKICGQKWQTQINYLSHAVDVYADWIDACESVAQEAVAQEAEDRKFSSYAADRRGGAAPAARSGDDEEGEADYDDE